MIEKNRLAIECDSGAEDFKSLCYFTLFFKKRITIIFFAFVAVFSIILFVSAFTGIVNLPRQYVVVYGGLLVLIALLLLAQKFMINRLITKNEETFRSKRIYILDKDVFQIQGDKTSLNEKIIWDRFYQAYEVQNYFYLYITNQQAYVLPKNIMTDEEKSFARHLLEEKLGKAFRCRAKE